MKFWGKSYYAQSIKIIPCAYKLQGAGDSQDLPMANTYGLNWIVIFINRKILLQ